VYNATFNINQILSWPLGSRNCLPFRSTGVHSWVFSGVCVAWSFNFLCSVCRSWFVLLSLLFWPLCCLSFNL